MAIAPSDVVTRARNILQDTTTGGTRWLDAELYQWMSDAQREVVVYRPEASTTTANVTLSTNSSRQTLPSGAVKLLDIIRNINTGRAVRLVAREVMDAQNPYWHNSSPATEIVHFVFDDRDPKAFYVYPRPSSSFQVEAVYAVSPIELTSSSSAFAIPDIYANVLLDYVLYRAYLKDSEYAGNAQRALAHYTAFANALGIRTQSDMKFGPISNFNPNSPAAMSGVAK